MRSWNFGGRERVGARVLARDGLAEGEGPELRGAVEIAGNDDGRGRRGAARDDGGRSAADGVGRGRSGTVEAGGRWGVNDVPASDKEE